MLEKLVAAFPTGARNGESPLEWQLEARTAERDFFRDRYTAQIEEMEVMRAELKEAQRSVQRLRDQILERESQIMREQQEQSDAKANQHEEGGGNISSNTSITSAATSRCEEESSSEMLLSAPTSGDENEVDVAEHDLVDTTTEIMTEQRVVERQVEYSKQVHITDTANGKDNSEDESGSDEDDEDEEAAMAKIRANAAKMLIWANYQTTRPRKSVSGDDDDGSLSSSVPLRRSSSSNVAGLMTAPALVQTRSSIGSNSRYQGYD